MSNAKNPECCNLYNYSRACGSFSSRQSLFWNWGWGAEGPPCRYGRARGQKASQSSTREIIKRAWHRMHAGAHSNTPEHWPCSSKQCREWLAFQKYSSSLVLEKGIDKILQILFWSGEIKIKYLVLRILASSWETWLGCWTSRTSQMQGTKTIWNVARGKQFIVLCKALQCLGGRGKEQEKGKGNR